MKIHAVELVLNPIHLSVYGIQCHISVGNEECTLSYIKITVNIILIHNAELQIIMYCSQNRYNYAISCVSYL